MIYEVPVRHDVPHYERPFIIKIKRQQERIEQLEQALREICRLDSNIFGYGEFAAIADAALGEHDD